MPVDSSEEGRLALLESLELPLRDDGHRRDKNFDTLL
jgi:hypothetical protein